MRHSNIDVVYVPTGLKKNRTRMLKTPSVLQIMDPDDTDIFGPSIIVKNQNCSDELEEMCLADFATNYMSKTANMHIENEDIKSYTVPVSVIDVSVHSTKFIALKNNLDKMKKQSHPYYAVLKRFQVEKPWAIICQLYAIIFSCICHGEMIRGELKECVPASAITKVFPFMTNNTKINFQRKQDPAILGHAITIHKSQGSILYYMKSDLNQSTRKYFQSGEEFRAPIGPGLFYIFFSWAKAQNKVQLLNFQPEQIKVNESALKEIILMRLESLFSSQHPLAQLTGSKISLVNIRSWNAHIQNFLPDKVYTQYCSLMCFTEIHCSNNGRPFNNIEHYADSRHT